MMVAVRPSGGKPKGNLMLRPLLIIERRKRNPPAQARGRRKRNRGRALPLARPLTLISAGQRRQESLT